jgi:L-asparaginase
MQIAVLATGGTFDKEYNELNGTLYFKQTSMKCWNWAGAGSR